MDKAVEKPLRIALAVLLLGALFNMPYGYYALVRFVGMAGFVLIAYREQARGAQGWALFWLCSALLINPFFKVSLGRTLWNAADLVWAILLVLPLMRRA